jgi:hypothetical protein
MMHIVPVAIQPRARVGTVRCVRSEQRMPQVADAERQHRGKPQRAEEPQYRCACWKSCTRTMPLPFVRSVPDSFLSSPDVMPRQEAMQALRINSIGAEKGDELAPP